MPFPRKGLRWALAAALGALAPALQAQEQAPSPAPAPEPAPAEAETAQTDPGVGTLLDSPVNRADYRLGPGDRLALAVFGDNNFQANLTVTPDGTLVIPNIGVTRVLGLSVNEAEARVRAAILRLYQNVNVNLNLSGVRSFKVYVVGAVSGAGMRSASAVTRVSEVVGTSGSRRNVLLRRASGDSLLVDLARFRLLGDLSSNPTLREGDALVLRSVDETVQVLGRVAFPGAYEYRRGETLAELLELVNGGAGFPTGAADSIRVSRFVSNEQRTFLVLSQEEAQGARGRSFVLQPFDAVYVSRLANYKRQRTATIAGEVLRPGTYPIRPDTTTVRELVAMAGGFTPEASLIDASLTRVPAPVAAASVRELQAVGNDGLTDDERRILRVAQGGTGRVVIDFRRVFAENGDAYDQPLKDGDAVRVPERRDDITVLGAVRQPGIVPYTRGRALNHYVGLVGGYSRRADPGDIVVLKGQTGARLSWREAGPLEPGDALIVPFAQRRNPLAVLQTTAGLISSVTGIVFTYLALFDR